MCSVDRTVVLAGEAVVCFTSIACIARAVARSTTDQGNGDSGGGGGGGDGRRLRTSTVSL